MPILKYSRYTNSVLVKDSTNGTWVSGRELLIKSTRSDDIVYTWKENDRYDLLSQKFYGSPMHWWVIAEWNDKLHFLDLPSPGDVIKFPSLKRLVGEVI